MLHALSLLAYAAPLVLIAAGLLARREGGVRPDRALAVTRLATLGAGAVAIVAALAVFIGGPVSSPLIGAQGLGLQVRLDALSVIMALLVTFIGWVVVRFSRNYMDGDDRQGPFIGGLCLTLGAVLMLVLSGNIVQLVLAWVATSLSLHSLLLFYPDRPGARLAARKKFLFARVGDLFLITAAATLYTGFGTGDIAAIATALQSGAAPIPGTLPLAGLCLAVTALLKSAQFPTHGWLTEVMETPTPVSALLHAGVVNAGGFLLIRFADVMLASSAAMIVVILVAGATAAIASLVMLTQTSVKVSLAWSTVAQMGFMLLQIGFGAFSAALLHIVAHSLYKAHAFLGSGSVVDLARAKLGHRLAPPRLKDAALAVVIGAAVMVTTGYAFGVTIESKPALVVLGAIMVLAVSHLMTMAFGQKSSAQLAFRAVAASLGLSVVYFALQLGAEALTANALPAIAPVSPAILTLMFLMLGVFAAVALIQVLALSASRPAWLGALQVHLRNGLYVNTYLNRLIGTPARA